MPHLQTIHRALWQERKLHIIFDLVAFWKGWCATVEKNRPAYPVRVRVAPEFIPWLPYVFGEPIRDEIARAGPADEQGRLTLTLRFEGLEEARDRAASAQLSGCTLLTRNTRDFEALAGVLDVEFYDNT